MTIFEYLSVAASIVLALGISKLVSSVRHVFAPGRRDWLHVVLFAYLFLAHLLQWWRFWPLHDIQSWNFIQFLIVIGSPICLYLAAAVLVSDSPSEVDSWSNQLAEVHRWFFGAMALAFIIGNLRAEFVLNGQLQPLRLVVGLATLLTGAIVSNRTVHALVAALLWFGLVFLIHNSFTAVSN